MFRSISNKKKSECSVCGLENDWPIMTIDSPIYYHQLNEEQKKQNGILGNDFCEIKYGDQKDRFVRAILSFKVKDHAEKLQYNLWVSLSEQSYLNYMENRKESNFQATYFAWLANLLPEYDHEIIKIPARVFIQNGAEFPELSLDPSNNHPLVHDFLNGISITEAEKRIH